MVVVVWRRIAVQPMVETFAPTASTVNVPVASSKTPCSAGDCEHGRAGVVRRGCIGDDAAEGDNEHVPVRGRQRAPPCLNGARRDHEVERAGPIAICAPRNVPSIVPENGDAHRLRTVVTSPTDLSGRSVPPWAADARACHKRKQRPRQSNDGCGSKRWAH